MRHKCFFFSVCGRITTVRHALFGEKQTNRRVGKYLVLIFIYLIYVILDPPVASAPLPTLLPDTVAQTLHSPRRMRRSSS